MEQNPKTPESIKSKAADYANDAWRQYTMDELGQWVARLTQRSFHRANPVKHLKDLEDAQNYLNMMQARLDAAKTF